MDESDHKPHTTKESLLFLKDLSGLLKSKIYKHTTSISKNVYINRLDKIVDKYNKRYDGTIKNGIEHGILRMVLSMMTRILDLKLVTVWEYQNTEIFLQKATLQIGLTKSLWSKKIKILLLMISTTKKLFESSMKKSCRRQAKQNWELKK